MNGGRLNTRSLLLIAFVIGAVIAVVELFVRPTPDATFLIALTYLAAVVQGCVALAAAGVLAKGIWLSPIKRDLLSVYPILLLITVLFLILGVKMEIYGWTAHPPNGWLNVRFFMIRNFVVLLLTFLAARQLAVAVNRGTSSATRYAVLYVAMFIASQSLIAFDWFMSFDYPFINTLLGGFFFVEAFLIGLCVSAFILLFRMRAPSHGLTETLRDTAKMMFGFSVVWVGFFFAQLLVIWYGNIPEEVVWMLTRVSEPPYATLSRAVIIMVWVIPFLVLLSRPLKTVPLAMAAVGLAIIGGLFLEKLVIVLPVAQVNPLFLLVELGLMVVLVAAFLSSRDTVMPQ